MFRVILLDKPAHPLDFLTVPGDTAGERLPVLLNQQRREQQQIFPLVALSGAAEDQIMEGAQTAGRLAVKNHILGKNGQVLVVVELS